MYIPWRTSTPITPLRGPPPVGPGNKQADATPSSPQRLVLCQPYRWSFARALLRASEAIGESAASVMCRAAKHHEMLNGLCGVDTMDNIVQLEDQYMHMSPLSQAACILQRNGLQRRIRCAPSLPGSLHENPTFAIDSIRSTIALIHPWRIRWLARTVSTPWSSAVERTGI